MKHLITLSDTTNDIRFNTTYEEEIYFNEYDEPYVELIVHERLHFDGNEYIVNIKEHNYVNAFRYVGHYKYELHASYDSYAENYSYNLAIYEMN